MNASIAGELSLGKAGALQGGAQKFDGVLNHERAKSILEYVLQPQIHTGMCFSSATYSRMERTPDEKRDILRRFINDSGLKIASWAKQSGVDKNSIYNFLNEHSQALDLRTYAKLARTAEVPTYKLTGELPDPPSPTSVWVAGHVEAGMFREAIEWDQSLWYSVDVPIEPRFRKVAKALEVHGSSMNIDYPDGSVAIWVDILDFRPARDQDHVIVYCIRHDDTIEATIKELRVEGQTRWLWPRSHDPNHQTPIDISNRTDDIREIVIKGIVVGGYKPRPL